MNTGQNCQYFLHNDIYSRSLLWHLLRMTDNSTCKSSSRDLVTALNIETYVYGHSGQFFYLVMIICENFVWCELVKMFKSYHIHWKCVLIVVSCSSWWALLSVIMFSIVSYCWALDESQRHPSGIFHGDMWTISPYLHHQHSALPAIPQLISLTNY